MRRTLERGKRRGLALGALTVLCAIALSPPRLAQAEPTPEQALAETAFQEAKALLARKEYAKACPLFAASQRLDSGSGTMIALAHCHEQEGKLASAWSEFKQALVLAREVGRADRERFASDAIARLEPLLSKLLVTVDPMVAAIPGVEIRLDGAPFRSSVWNVSTPVNPGIHVLDATAPGYTTWARTFEIGPRADRRTVPIEKLEREPVPIAKLRK